jgi:CBS domain-containing protein
MVGDYLRAAGVATRRQSKTPQQTVGDASSLMAKFRIGLLIVVNDQQNIVGVLSEQDIAWSLGKSDENQAHVKVDDLMTKQVITCDPDVSVVYARAGMGDTQLIKPRQRRQDCRFAIGHIIGHTECIESGLDQSFGSDGRGIKAFAFGRIMTWFFPDSTSQIAEQPIGASVCVFQHRTLIHSRGFQHS